MSGPNDQQTKSFSGQMVILARHGLLTGRYVEQMKKKKETKYFYHLPSFPALLASVPCGQQFKASVYRLIASSNELDLNCLLPMSFKTRALSSSTWEKKSKRSLPKAISSWIHSLQNGRRKCHCKYKWREMQTP